MEGKVNGVAAPEKSGKSRLVNWLLVGMYRGYVLGLPTIEPPKTLYLAAEETVEDDLQSRLLQYAALQGVPPALLDIHFMAAMGMRLEQVQQRSWLEQRLLDEDFGMVLIDPLIRVHGAQENDNHEMSKILTFLRHLATKRKVTVIIVHHSPKPTEETNLLRMNSWFRGASDIAAVIDMGMYVNRLKNTKKPNDPELIQLLRGGRTPPMAPLMIRDDGDMGGFVKV
jgi:RecA-family ATPase